MAFLYNDNLWILLLILVVDITMSVLVDVSCFRKEDSEMMLGAIGAGVAKCRVNIRTSDKVFLGWP